MNILDFALHKKNNKKITMVTCYDYTSARIIAETNIDCVLVGDSVAMTMHGHQDTIAADITMMCHHTRAVKRGIGNQFLIADLPFLSYRKSRTKALDAVHALFQAGAEAVKLENAKGNLALIRHLTESGIPVMGHLGLAGQFIHTLGGFKVQGKTKSSQEAIFEDAKVLQEAGCFALVLECIPSELAKMISKTLTIPTIGIGAGADTDGQVLVWQDLLGLNRDFKPKFVKKYLDGSRLFQEAINQFVHETQCVEFPTYEYCYNS